MENLVKIGEFIAETEKSAKEVAENLINAGFVIATQENYPECFVVCKKIKTE